MKKIIILSFFAVAAMTIFSCTKERTSEINENNENLATLVIGVPDVSETKVSNGTPTDYMGSIRYTFNWDAGDALNIFSYNNTKDEYTDWGNYTTLSGGKPATFTGTIPVSYTGSTFVAMHSKSTGSFVPYWNSTRYDFKFNIPAEQDGTGAKYCMFAAAPEYDSEKHTFTIPTSGSYQMYMRSALSVIDVPAVADVRRITITVTAAKTGAAHNVVSKGDAKDVYLNGSSYALWGAGSNVITIYNNNDVLSDKVWFATRQTTGNATNGYIILTFVFTNGSGQTATKVAKLGTSLNGDGTAGTYKNILTTRVNNFGSITFDPSDWS